MFLNSKSWFNIYNKVWKMYVFQLMGRWHFEIKKMCFCHTTAPNPVLFNFHYNREKHHVAAWYLKREKVNVWHFYLINYSNYYFFLSVSNFLSIVQSSVPSFKMWLKPTAHIWINIQQTQGVLPLYIWYSATIYVPGVPLTELLAFLSPSPHPADKTSTAVIDSIQTLFHNNSNSDVCSQNTINSLSSLCSFRRL